MKFYGMEDGIDIHTRVLNWLASKEGNLRQGEINIVNCGYGVIGNSGAYLQRYLIIVSGDNTLGEEQTTLYLTHGSNIIMMPWHLNAFTSMEERKEFCKNVNSARLAKEKSKNDFGSDEIGKMVKTFVDEMKVKHREKE